MPIVWDVQRPFKPSSIGTVCEIYVRWETCAMMLLSLHLTCLFGWSLGSGEGWVNILDNNERRHKTFIFNSNAMCNWSRQESGAMCSNMLALEDSMMIGITLHDDHNKWRRPRSPRMLKPKLGSCTEPMTSVQKLDCWSIVYVDVCYVTGLT